MDRLGCLSVSHFRPSMDSSSITDTYGKMFTLLSVSHTFTKQVPVYKVEDFILILYGDIVIR